jgi:hypothetical protein
LSCILLLGLLKPPPLFFLLLPPPLCLLLSFPNLLLLSQSPDFLLKQPIFLLLLAILSFSLRLTLSSEFLDGKFGRLSRHGCYDDDDDDDETKPSPTLAFIRLGSVHGPITASRAQPKKGRGILSGFHQVALQSSLNGLRL